jgi:hypothetical protein
MLRHTPLSDRVGRPAMGHFALGTLAAVAALTRRSSSPWRWPLALAAGVELWNGAVQAAAAAPRSIVPVPI